MPGKRRRLEAYASAQNLTTGDVKPISAIAAAKSRARVPVDLDGSQRISPSPSLDSSESGYVEESLVAEPGDVNRNLHLCTWRYEKENVISEDENQLTILLNKNKTVAFVGHYNLAVLKGAVNVNGANLASKARQAETPVIHPVYVPSTHPITVIRGLDHDNHLQISNSTNPTPLALLNPSFGNIWSGNPRDTPSRSFTLVTESKTDPIGRPIYPLLTPDDWFHQIEECATTSSVVVLTGPKSSGKSTFAKRLLNRYLTGFGKHARPQPVVYFLDLDPTKQEYGPDGLISLTRIRELNLGPSYTHPTISQGQATSSEVILSFPFPTKAFSDHMEYFKSCVDEFTKLYAATQPNEAGPMIVKIAGEMFTSCYPAVLQIIPAIKPQRIIHFTDLDVTEEPNSGKVDSLTAAAAKARSSYHQISAQAPLNTPSRSDAELRSMHMAACFHGIRSENAQSTHSSYNPMPLSHIKPWEFWYEETDISQQNFVGFMLLGEPVPVKQLHNVLVGSVVHIVSTSDSAVQSLFKVLPRTTKYRIPYFEPSATGSVQPLNPLSCKVTCTALIRGWDPERRVVQLLVPSMFESRMHSLEPERTVLVGGCCETPEWAFTEDAYFDLSEKSRNEHGNEKHANEVTNASPWATTASAAEEMSYLNTTRRVRKFHQ